MRDIGLNKFSLLARSAFAATLVAINLAACHHDATGEVGTGALRQNHRAPDTVVLEDQQLKNVQVATVQSVQFVPTVETLGYIDFDQDRSVPVFPTVTGHIRSINVQSGDVVRKGQILYTLDSPDFVTAQSNLIASAGTLKLTSAALERARRMLEIQANAQKDVEQAQADHQNAESAYRSAQGTLRVFGLSDADIARILERHQVDTELPVRSSMNGRVTARNAAPGVLVQPGTGPAPLTITDATIKWMIASPGETDLAHLQVGQAVLVKVQAYPDRTFGGRITNIGAAFDPNTHRVAVRSEVRDPENLLRPQMMASFRIETGPPSVALAVPADAVVRESDGTMTLFVTPDGRSFIRRTVDIGYQRDNMIAIVSGIRSGEQVATRGALFLSNALALQSQ
ncbi:efflux RND transporter periplasmic adaptor subunit [Massilia putida]|uniref:efflux RND transporter periplasmic adaptor subunit n=1 Tax=Massilia putida TaxID=1141883 RepID=UPI0009F93168|nr:efflux RND transporter periplasmic adaptor subunit [Massilia putida]